MHFVKQEAGLTDYKGRISPRHHPDDQPGFIRQHSFYRQHLAFDLSREQQHQQQQQYQYQYQHQHQHRLEDSSSCHIKEEYAQSTSSTQSDPHRCLCFFPTMEPKRQSQDYYSSPVSCTDTKFEPQSPVYGKYYSCEADEQMFQETMDDTYFKTGGMNHPDDMSGSTMHPASPPVTPDTMLMKASSVHQNGTMVKFETSRNLDEGCIDSSMWTSTAATPGSATHPHGVHFAGYTTPFYAPSISASAESEKSMAEATTTTLVSPQTVAAPFGTSMKAGSNAMPCGDIGNAMGSPDPAQIVYLDETTGSRNNSVGNSTFVLQGSRNRPDQDQEHHQQQKIFPGQVAVLQNGFMAGAMMHMQQQPVVWASETPASAVMTATATVPPHLVQMNVNMQPHGMFVSDLPAHGGLPVSACMDTMWLHTPVDSVSPQQVRLVPTPVPTPTPPATTTTAPSPSCGYVSSQSVMLEEQPGTKTSDPAMMVPALPQGQKRRRLPSAPPQGKEATATAEGPAGKKSRTTSKRRHSSRNGSSSAKPVGTDGRSSSDGRNGQKPVMHGMEVNAMDTMNTMGCDAMSGASLSDEFVYASPPSLAAETLPTQQAATMDFDPMLTGYSSGEMAVVGPDGNAQSSSSSAVAAAATSAEAEAMKRRLEDRMRKDQFLLEQKRAGLTYKEIRRLGNFVEAESTLRGRHRTLTKPKEERVRKPVWSDDDDRLLRRAVRRLSRGVGRSNGSSVHGKGMKEQSSRLKVSWKAVADYIYEQGGSYHFGNTTCRKRWDYLMQQM